MEDTNCIILCILFICMLYIILLCGCNNDIDNKLSQYINHKKNITGGGETSYWHEFPTDRTF